MTEITKTVYIKTLGCPLREQDEQRLKDYFQKNNYILTDNVFNAFIKVYITCALNQDSIDRSLIALNEDKIPNGLVIITGCLPVISPKIFQNDEKTILLPIKDINKIDSYFNNFAYKYSDIRDGDIYRTEIHPFGRDEFDELKNLFRDFEFTSRYFYRFTRRIHLIKRVYLNKKKFRLECKSIRISNGCVSNCSFCGIKYAVGKLKSKSIQNILSEYNNLISQGYINIILLADDTGSYGVDNNLTLPRLLQALHNQDHTDKVYWSFQDLSPYWALKYKNNLIEYFKANRIHEILFTVQSGSDRILDAMRRGYKTHDVLNMIRFFHKANPKMRILSNFIIGFPGETEDDFDKTLQFVKSFKFDFIYLFKYFENEVCESREIFPKISDEIINNRIQRIEVVLKKQKTYYYTL